MTKITTMKPFYYRNRFGTVFTVFIHHNNLGQAKVENPNFGIQNDRPKWTPKGRDFV